ncbi:wall-associated receptor kinase 2-like [Bidens hawaiensis]|uniref:wall-associated receptor kinase 2-like n=1 Tax=Bidens hawaiensis TaxID=980011 RepID=UPI00404A554E
MLLLFTLVLFNSLALNLALPLPQSATGNLAKPGCQTECGSLTVAYPFGIGVGSGCSKDPTFDLICNSTGLFINGSADHIQIHNILGSEMRVTSYVASKCYNQHGNATAFSRWFNLTTTPFSFSKKNNLTVIGCSDFAAMTDGVGFVIGCFGICEKAEDVSNGNCKGVGCGQTAIPGGVKAFEADTGSTDNHASVMSFNPCSFAFLGDETFQFDGLPDLSSSSKYNTREPVFPTLLEWVIESNRSCKEANECKGNSSCTDHTDIGGYRCECKGGYEGNPYLDPGCRDIDECKDNSSIRCYGQCINTEGSYNCTCEKGYIGDATKKDGCRLANGSKFPITAFTLALVFGMVALLSGMIVIYLGIKKRKLINLREKFFEQNGGVFLKQKLNAPGTNEVVTIFSTKQLQKATDNYSEERIIGRGGYGTVYKGILPNKGGVAIKKSKVVDGAQAEQFINEVMILTHVIQRNVVKLLGCCLEEEVPVLVYEFISNNTLFHHIHHRVGGMSWLSWENRLRVAVEVAGALAYLHSETIMPIIHRDVKSANILLDDNYTAKIADFGASRLVPLDHEQVTTLVQGTLGYLDPEYFHTSQLTDKSDVYSFGVVLAELITGQKSLCVKRTDDEKNLATYFVKAMKQNRILEIVDPRVLREGTPDQLKGIGDLVKRCLSLHGNDRPTMKDVAMELEGLKKFKNHPWGEQKMHEESRSLILEIEQRDLYGIPLIPHNTSECESFSCSSNTIFQENKPR